MHLLIIAIVQGITEFLPISSSGHLILIPELTDWPDQGLLIDVAVHVGTLGAVLAYFWRDTRGLFLAAVGAMGLQSARRRTAGSHYPRLLWLLILATIPVILAGLLFVGLGVSDALRRADVIGTTSIVFGLALYWVDQRCLAEKDLKSLNWRAALVVGLVQIMALVPGTSRAGITMTAARGLGFGRAEAAHFSMLLAIPTILAAGTLGAYELVTTGPVGAIKEAVFAAGLSFLTAMGAIHFLMRWLERASMTIFVVYRVVLGVGLLAWVYA
jgi:undecaprenyl-diphosphatase